LFFSKLFLFQIKLYFSVSYPVSIWQQFKIKLLDHTSSTNLTHRESLILATLFPLHRSQLGLLPSRLNTSCHFSYLSNILKKMNFIEFMQHSYENFAGNVQYFHYTGLHPAEKVTINAVF